VIVDLAGQAEAQQTRKADVLVIGAGIAGLILAARLCRAKVRVVVFESGGREQELETHPLNRTVQLGDPYSGATYGRYRCLGGTSTRWGGALIPFVPHDLAPRPYLGLTGFPVGFDALRPYLAEAEKLFQVDEGPYDEEFVYQIAAAKLVPTGDPDFQARFAKWPSFRNRNVATLLRPLIKSDRSLEIWINSTATSLEMDRDTGRITSVTGCWKGHRSITVSAKHVVICAGAIESTRLLLLLDRQHDQRLSAGCSALGRFFNDHISLLIAKIRAKQITKLNRMAGFRFVGSTMRSLRFELSAETREQEGVGGAFGHISFQSEKETSFDAIRDFMRSLQRGGHIHLGLLSDGLRDLPYLAKMGLWRAMYRQLLWPVPSTYGLHVVAEQLPRASNFICLSSEKDCFGLPIAAIQWHIGREDLKTFEVFKRRFKEFWNRHGLLNVGELDWMYDPEVSQRLSTDVFHPGGSTRMGIDRREAVVDSNLRSFEVPNLWVSSTSVFPSGGGENPTLMLILFTMRLADHLSNRIKAQ
jgi:choline dehydrogenase-like flavoprotein